MIQYVRAVGKFVRALIANVFKHDIASLSAQVCFYAIFSLFPLITLIIYGANLLVPNAQIEQMLLQALKPYYPAISNASDFIKTNIQSLGSVGAKIGLVSSATLVWSATSAFIAVQQAMDSIFELKDQRSFFARRVVAFTMLVLLVLVAMLSTLALGLYSVLSHQVALVPAVQRWLPVLHAVSRVIYPTSLFVTCFIFYRYMPSKRVDINSVLIGALTATVGLDLARAFFVVYASHLVTYHLIYGVLAVVMLLVLWMYVAGMIMLFGAEIAALLDRTNTENTETTSD